MSRQSDLTAPASSKAATEFIYIDNAGALAEWCAEQKGIHWFAVDTEFEREKTYYPEWCLLQLATEKVTAIIDPLSITDMTPVFDLLYDPAITKVFHAARQDLEIFFNIKRAVPQPVFDTQIAAVLLGYDKGIGYANLVEKVLGITLEKAHTRTQWKTRPLSANQLRYAADDVIYLARVYQKFAQELISSGRLPELEPEFTALGNPELYEPDPQTLWMKIRESVRMSGTKLAVLKQLAAWREITARAANRPRKWILSDQALIDMAYKLPANNEELSRIKDMPEGVVKRQGETLLKLIAAAQAVNPDTLNP